MTSLNRNPLTSFNFQPFLGQRWAINFEGTVVEISEVVIAKIQANPTHVIGWFNDILRKEWKYIFLLMAAIARDRTMSPIDLAWKKVHNPWWSFLMDLPTLGDE